MSAWCGLPLPSKGTTSFWNDWRTPSALVCFIIRAGWTLSLASWTSTLPVRVENSICAWISKLAKGFRREVLRHLPEIDYGHTASYSVVAAASGSPRAVRAVGTACAKNPLPLVVPCHRVVRSDGSLGQYAGGPELKAILLDLEAGR